MVTPTKIYEQAADAIAAGRFREVSRLAYEAAFAATVDAAARHNAPCASDAEADEFLLWLDNPPFPLEEWHKHYDLTGKNLLPIPKFTASFRVALSFRKHAETLAKQPDGDCAFYWDEDEYALYLTAVKGLINDLENAHPNKERLWTARHI